MRRLAIGLAALAVAFGLWSGVSYASILLYDDEHWEYRVWRQDDVAVRFTPTTEYYLESFSALMCFAELYGPKFPVTATVWKDNAGTMGDVLFSQEVTDWVGDPDTWNTFTVGLLFSPGESFWAGLRACESNGSSRLFGSVWPRG